MKKGAFLGVACIAAAGALLWMTRQPVSARPEPVAAPAPAPAAKLPPPSMPAPEAPAAPAEAIAKALSANKVDISSDRFRNLKDEVIPGRLYGEAAKCYKGGGNRDEKIKLEFRMSIVDGQVTVPSVNVLTSTLTDKNLERCIIDEVRRARFSDAEMPDYESTEEILIRLRGFKSHQNQNPEEDQ
jgi:hypothetical protein